MTVRKIVSYFLIISVLVLSLIGILGVWGVINFEDVMERLMLSLLIVFASSAVILFIFNVLMKD